MTVNIGCATSIARSSICRIKVFGLNLIVSARLVFSGLMSQGLIEAPNIVEVLLQVYRGIVRRFFVDPILGRLPGFLGE